ncbi:laccase-1 precursor [Tothia fuscella]|uniref:Laccase-1 n=1 Tax=Tothia fuscella TaxID=1048955 RepID=A0A9P4U3L0_9PEZI|nr:laccase-1 precursor [Tothia fuscella]
MSSCGKMPNTGVTRKYTMDVSYQVIAPDGVTKNGLVVNGGFPGPLIEANWGDWIEVSVTNNLPDEGTSLHWHGLLQADTPWFDGVPAVSQCPIAPGQTKVYKFRADHYGTTWYHSHYSGQYAGGALGPIVIHGPKTAEYDEDIGPVILSDWYHKDYFSITQDTMAGRIPSSDNNLINGKMNYPCANTTFACTPNAGVSKFHFKAGKKYRLRLINTSAEGIQKFTIDGHTFTVIANDFIPINPYTTDVITLGVGQRSDVIVEAVGNDGDSFWMRANLGTFTTGCSLTTGVSPEGLAVVYYDSASPNTVPTTKSSLTAAALADCGNDPLETTTALCAVTPDPVPATTQQIDITFGSNGTNFIWFMNNQTYRGNYNHPVLQQVKQGNLTFEDEWNVYNMGTASSIRLVFKNFFAFGAHPMHLHGHDFHVLAEGFGDWDGTVVNPSNTQMRDVQLLRPGKRDGTPSYIVMQWTNDNSGVWPLHCHIAWHVSAGLYVNILERPDDIQKRHFPASSFETCAAWDAWTSSNVPNQIDSGL